ncbi:MAG: carboxypeptidase regulatory-like domain-containing protein [Planctomycetota bacterium]|nr:carboxypeptidase regulatory-like domain-containing protein [Planctomycetota bacterium]
MKKSAWLVILGVVVLVGGLDALGVLPLGLFGERTPDGAGDDPLTIESGDGDEAGLEGRGTAKVEEDANGDTPLEVETIVPAEVRGTTRNGASVRGRVVIASTRKPVSGVTVELRRPDSLFHYMRAKPKGRFDLLTAKTGRDGRFAFLDVTPNKGYVVRCRFESYAHVSSFKLDLRGGEREDLGDLELGPAGEVATRVLDAEGNPVAGVRVAVTWMVDNNLSVILADPDTLPEIEAEGETDAEGRVTIEGLEPGDKTLIASAPTGAAEVIRKFGVQEGETTELPDIKLAGNGVIAGMVVFDDDTPVPGARVFAGPSTNATMRTVETGADGAFRIEWLPDGKHVVGVLVPGLPVKILMNNPVGREDMRVVFPKPGSLSGVVVNATTGAAVPRFGIVVEKKNVTDFQEQMVSAMIRQVVGPRGFEDAEGKFTYEPLAVGTYKITVSAPGYPDVIQEPVTVTAGDGGAPIRVEMPQGHTARGSVTTKAGDPLARARIYVLRQQLHETQKGRRLLEVVEDLQPDARTRTDGTFELPPQAPGKITIVATHELGLPAVVKGIDVTAADVDDVEIVLEPSGRVTGQLLTDGGRPAKRQQVYVLYPDGTVFREWIEDGRFDFDMLPVGHCVVRWLSVRDVRRYKDVITSPEPEGKREAYDELREDGGEHYIGAGQEVKVTIRLPARVRFRGQLRVDAAPATQGGIWITIPEGAWGHWAEVDESGWFEAEVESGKYTIWAPNAKGEWSSDEIEVPDQQTYTKDFDR